MKAAPLRVSKFISAKETKAGITYRVLIDRKNFKRSKNFTDLDEAKTWRDQQMLDMPESLRPKGNPSS